MKGKHLSVCGESGCGDAGTRGTTIVLVHLDLLEVVHGTGRSTSTWPFEGGGRRVHDIVASPEWVDMVSLICCSLTSLVVHSC